MANVKLCLIVLVMAMSVHCAEEPRIVGYGRFEAKPHEAPFFGYIVNRDSGDLITGCVLIRPRVVLALAWNYITTIPSEIKVILGSHDRSVSESTVQVINVKKIVPNPEFVKSLPTGTGDLALIQLEEAAVLGPAVKILNVKKISQSPEQDKKLWRKPDYVHNQGPCHLFGYGLIQKTKFLKRWPKKLQKQIVDVKSPNVCANYWKNSFGDEVSAFKNNKWLCSINRDITATCDGDGASPLVCENSARTEFTLYGLAIGGTKYCNKGFSFYTRLSAHTKWIIDVSGTLQRRGDRADSNMG